MRKALTRCIKPIVLAILCVVSHVLSLGQEPVLHSIQLTTEQGLPSPEVYCVVQDKQGHMWFGTDNGACRYNGYEFEVFDAEDGLANNVVFEIFEDEKERIWFGTLKGHLYYFLNDSIHAYKYNSVFDSLELFHNQGHLYTVFNDTIKSALEGFGMITIDPNGRYTRLVDKNRIMFYQTDERYVFSKGQCIFHKDHKQELLDSLPLTFYKNGKSTNIVLDGIKSLSKTSISGLNTRGYKFISLGKYLLLFDKKNIVQKIDYDSFVLAYLVTEDGGIWFGLQDNKGLRHYKDKQALLENEYTSYFEGETISDFKLINNKLWVSTIHSGVFFVPNLNLTVYNDFADSNVDGVRSVAISNNDNVFITLADGEIMSLDHKRNIIQNLNFPSISGRNADLTGLWYEPSNSSLWSYSNYVYVDGRWRDAFLPHTRSYAFDPLDSLIVIATNQGIHKIDIKTRERQDTSGRYYKNQLRTNCYVRGRNFEWIGTNKGLFYRSEGEWNKYVPKNIKFNARVEDLIIDDHGRIIMGTKGHGLGIIENDSLYFISNKNGIASNMIEDIDLFNGRLYVGSLLGLSVISNLFSDSLEINNYNTSYGLPGNEIYYMSSQNDQLWICSNKGLFKWEELSTTANTFAPILNQVLVNSIPSKSVEKFDYQESNFEFEYYTIDYDQLGDVIYRYRIDYGNDWQVSKSTNVNFANLNPGNYNFQVQSRNRTGSWSESIVFPFRIKPPWWNTWFARTLYVISFGGFVYYLYSNRIKRLNEKSAIALEIQELQRMATQAQMNPHFIFNCLNSIQSFINQDEKEKANAYLVLFSRLVRASLNASMKKVHSLEDEVALLTDYIDLEKMRFKSAFEYDIKVDESIETYDTFLPPMLIQPIVENAIKHGLLPKENDDNKLEVLFHEENDHLIVHVIDNGVGLKPQHSNGHKSIGLSNTKKRLDLFNGSSENNMVIADNGAVGLEGGTRVKLRLKKLPFEGY